MKLLKSQKFKLPVLYFITDRKEIKEIPIGIPFIYGDAKDEEYIIRILEYEILYEKAIKSGLPFNFKKILEDAGYTGLQKLFYYHPMFIDLKTEDLDLKDDYDDYEIESIKDSEFFKSFIKDAAVYVDVKKLKELNIFPIWLDKIENSVQTNIHNFAIYNPNMYNKKLEGIYGALELTTPNRNLIIIDISGSIPKGVSSTCLALSKNLAETFYADLLITGSKSTLYYYENLNELNIETIYDENQMDNDQVWFKKLLSSGEKHYKTAIVFGDNHNPGDNWSNEYNKNTKTISIEDGKKLCKWKIDKLISFHTKSTEYIAGYGLWFSPKEIEKIDNWVKYL